MRVLYINCNENGELERDQLDIGVYWNEKDEFKVIYFESG